MGAEKIFSKVALTKERCDTMINAPSIPEDHLTRHRPGIGDHVSMDGQDVESIITGIPAIQPQAEYGVFRIYDQYDEEHSIELMDIDDPTSWVVVIPRI